jgi:hypothetical protein
MDVHLHLPTSLAVLALALGGCLPAGPTTPRAALTALPEYLPTPVGYQPETVELLAEHDAAGGKVVVYRWFEARTGECHISAVYMLAENGGWLPQSTRDLEGVCAALSWQAVSLDGGNASDLSAVFGVSGTGSAVRVLWPDGQTSVAPLTNGVFVTARPKPFVAWELELLDEYGYVIASREVTE